MKKEFLFVSFSRLENGQLFRFNEKQRKERVFVKWYLLSSETIPEKDKGKILIIHDNCHQTIIHPSQQLIIRKY